MNKIVTKETGFDGNISFFKTRKALAIKEADRQVRKQKLNFDFAFLDNNFLQSFIEYILLMSTIPFNFMPK